MKMLCVVLLFASTAASAQESQFATATGSAPAATSSKAEKVEIICEKQTDVGTRLASRKICGTKQQWMQRRAEEVLRVRRGQAGGNPGG